MLKRYGNIDYVLKMPLKDAIEIINHAMEQEQKEYYYRFWLVRYPGYTEKNFETFEDFYDKYRPKKVQYDTRSKDEIMQDIMKIDRKEVG